MKAESDSLPPPGPPFRVGDEIAFFAVQISARDDPGWLQWDYAVIDEIDEKAGTFGFHFVSDPGNRQWQGMENIVRRTQTYYAWRAAYEAALAATGDPNLAYDRTRDVARCVAAEHPIYGDDVRAPRDIAQP